MAVQLNDDLCLRLAKFLSEYLNQKFLECYGNEYPDIRIVNGYEQYNKIDIALDHFPCLLVYRINDQYRHANQAPLANIQITYCCAYPDLEALPGLLAYVSKSLIEGISEYSYLDQKALPTREDRQPLFIQYGTASNQYIQQAHQYLQTNISLYDICSTTSCPS